MDSGPQRLQFWHTPTRATCSGARWKPSSRASFFRADSRTSPGASYTVPHSEQRRCRWRGARSPARWYVVPARPRWTCVTSPNSPSASSARYTVARWIPGRSCSARSPICSALRRSSVPASTSTTASRAGVTRSPRSRNRCALTSTALVIRALSGLLRRRLLRGGLLGRCLLGRRLLRGGLLGRRLLGRRLLGRRLLRGRLLRRGLLRGLLHRAAGSLVRQ